MPWIILEDTKSLKQVKYSRILLKDVKSLKQIKYFRIIPGDTRSSKQVPYFRIYSEDMKIIETNLPDHRNSLTQINFSELILRIQKSLKQI